MELDCYLGLGELAAWEEVVLLAIEVDPHEVHLDYIPHILFLWLLPVEKSWLIELVNRPSRNFIDLDPKRVILINILISQMNTLDLNIDIIQQIQKYLLDKAILLIHILFVLHRCLKLLQSLLYYLLFTTNERLIIYVWTIFSIGDQEVNVAYVYGNRDFIRTPG